jgi:hypothetical protein
MFTHEVRRDLAELFEGGFKVNDNLLARTPKSSGKIVGFFAAFVSEKEPSRCAHQ